MDNVIILRYGELFLKGKNRGFFERTLIKNIKEKLGKFRCNFSAQRGRYEISEYADEDEQAIVAAMKTVFGLQSLSIAKKCDSDLHAISDIILKNIPENATFKVKTHRADKTFSLTSPQVSCAIGEIILDKLPNSRVDLHNPEYEINVDIRETGKTYVYTDKIQCAGGMPVGTAGKGLLLLSGGIDSPVSAYMMSKRGLTLDAIHFYSYPYTSMQAKDKVKELACILSDYCGSMNLITIPFTQIQETIHKYCSADYMITIVRRFMMRVAEKVARMRDCGCLINGESLGQVASQTMQSITVTNDVVKTMPIFRPLIGMDKQEIVNISTAIGTYETSVLPFEDCCTVFMPDNPVTKPTIARAEAEEQKIVNIAELIEQAIDNLEIIEIKIQ